MAYTTIDDPSAHFQTQRYAGSGSDNKVVTNAGNSDLQPDFIWIKKRSASGQHVLSDTNRGILKVLNSNSTAAEDSNSEGEMVKSVQSDGFTLGDSQAGQGDTNYTSGATYVAWQWKANGGTTSSNSDGSITSTVQANTTAGFSIVTYTGTGSAATIGHGLGVTPDLIIVKTRNNNVDWQVYLDLFGNDDEGLFLNLNSAKFNSTNYWNNGATNSVFGVSSNTGVGANSFTYVAYCFASIQGYSKIGSYTGNGNADGPFVYTGFTPAWVMIKRTDGGTNNWPIWDYERGFYNGARAELYANLTNAEATDSAIDILSNGFKLRNASTEWNNGDYIYMAFAKHPFVSSKGVPTTAV